MASKNESTFTMQPLSPVDGVKKPSFADPQTSDVEPGQIIQTHERGSLHQSFSARKLQVRRQSTFTMFLFDQNSYVDMTGHCSRIQHRQRSVHRHRQSIGVRRARKHASRIPDRLLRCLGKRAVFNRNDRLVSYFWELCRLRWTLG